MLMLRHVHVRMRAVMISAGFVHLLGDSIKQLVASFNYPLAPFLCACGYLFTLVADQTVEGISGLGHGHVAHQADGDSILLTQVMVGVSPPTDVMPLPGKGRMFDLSGGFV